MSWHVRHVRNVSAAKIPRIVFAYQSAGCVPAILTTTPYVKLNVCSPKTRVVSQSLQVDSEKVPPVGPRLHCPIFFTIHYPINIHRSTCRISAAGSVFKWNVNKLNTQVLIKPTNWSINQSSRLNVSNPGAFITPLWRNQISISSKLLIREYIIDSGL